MGGWAKQDGVVTTRSKQRGGNLPVLIALMPAEALRLAIRAV